MLGPTQPEIVIDHLIKIFSSHALSVENVTTDREGNTLYFVDKIWKRVSKSTGDLEDYNPFSYSFEGGFIEACSQIKDIDMYFDTRDECIARFERIANAKFKKLSKEFSDQSDVMDFLNIIKQDLANKIEVKSKLDNASFGYKDG